MFADAWPSAPGGEEGASLEETPPPLNVLNLLETSTCVDLQTEGGVAP
jgi:hypothetical protein